MAVSLAHRWGQIIGDVFEQFVRDMLSSISGRKSTDSILISSDRAPREAARAK